MAIVRKANPHSNRFEKENGKVYRFDGEKALRNFPMDITIFFLDRGIEMDAWKRAVFSISDEDYQELARRVANANSMVSSFRRVSLEEADGSERKVRSCLSQKRNEWVDAWNW